MEETMNEIQDNVDYTNIEDMAAEKVAERIDVNAEGAYNYLKEYGDLDARDIAEGIDLNDLAYHIDKDDVARELSLSDLSYELDLDDLASYVSARMADKVEVNLRELASEISMSGLAEEIDHDMLAVQLAESEVLFPDVVQQMLAEHDKHITNMLGDIVVSLNKIIGYRLSDKM